jgi:hypothetical protein
MEYVVLGFLLTPIWLPLLRFAILWRASETRWNRARNWAFAVTLAWSGGGVLFLWASNMPSGIPYGIVLLIGWLLLPVSIVLDMRTDEEVQPPKEIE